ncbi:arginine N-methyltransferase [Strigomonas culicis]|uniref:Arginine N-methyltransferase n=2 Tax=Strigomonas culicis TaxID=28005 RepID=S9VYK3_9TRYP|nr:arginine N-methyltransferase [Strigomonas culicis]|eukprot:EPY28765.1 arginine N-methyltransferase [Strigomonas culicis]
MDNVTMSFFFSLPQNSISIYIYTLSLFFIVKGRAMSGKHGGVTLNKNNKRKKLVYTESLLGTDQEKFSTSKSLYGDSAARVCSNVWHVHDHVRQRAYDALFRNMKDKTLLHMGCGIGLGSMIAARQLAKHVVAVDTSAIVEAARVVAAQNHIDNITFVRGHVRDAVLQQQRPLPVQRFDVILCEWMGAFLLNDPILPDVLYARDHLLIAPAGGAAAAATPRGVICPNRASLYIAGVSDYYFRLDTEDFWSNVYGFRMEPMKALVRREVETCAIPAQNLVTNLALVHSVQLEDLPGLTPEEEALYERQAAERVARQAAMQQDSNNTSNPIEETYVPPAVVQKGFASDFALQATRNATIHYLTFYVDAAFTSPVDPGANFVINVKPGGNNAWTEVSVGLLEPLPVAAGEIVRGSVSVRTPAEGTGKFTYIHVKAKTEGKVAQVETQGEYVYQSY